MLPHLKQILGNAAIYGVGTLLVQFASFLLLPLYTRVLGPEDYGVLSLLWVVQTVLSLVGELALTSAVFRFYHDQPDNHDKDKLLSSSFWLMAANGAILLMAVTALAPIIAPTLFNVDNSTQFLRIVAVTAWLTPLSTLLLRTLQLWRRPLLYVATSMAQFLVTVVTTITMVVFLDQGVWGVLVGQLSGIGAVAALCAVVLGRRLIHGIDRQTVSLLLRFSIPLVPTGMAALVIALSDRFFLEHYSTLTEVGLYAVADKMTAVLQVLIVVPLLLSWNQFAFSSHQSPDFTKTFVKTIRLVTFTLGAGILGYTFVIRELLQFATTPEFTSAWKVVPVLCAAPVGHALITLFATGVHLSRQTRWIPVIYGSGMLLNLALNYLFVPTYGMVGAAWATLCSTVVTVIGFGIAARRYYPIPYPFKPVVVTLTITALCTGLFVGGSDMVHSTGSQWAMRGCLLFLFFVLSWFLGVIDRTDIQMVKQLWHRMRSRTS